MHSKAVTLLKEFEQPKHTLYNNKEINKPDYNKTKLTPPFMFSDEVANMPIKKKSKK